MITLVSGYRALISAATSMPSRLPLVHTSISTSSTVCRAHWASAISAVLREATRR